MFGVSNVLLAKLVTAAVHGNTQLIAELAEKKIESLGQEVLSNLAGSKFAIAQRVISAIETGGESEFDNLRRDWLNRATPQRLSYQARLQSTIDKVIGGPSGSRGHHWWHSREEWLNNQWRHDWRSQPRDTRGRWLPGRLDHIYMQASQRSLRRRDRKILQMKAALKLQRARRKAGREDVRGLISGMAEPDPRWNWNHDGD